MKVKNLVLVSLFTSLTAMGAFISIPLGPISLSLQSFFVILSGIILGPSLGALSQVVYVLLGLLGLPIFSGLRGGFHYIFSPSFGFLLGFIFSSFFSGLLYKKLAVKESLRPWLSSLMGTLIIYLFGLPYMHLIFNILGEMNMGFTSILKLGFLIFLPGDLVKIIIISLVSGRILTRIK